MPEANAALNLRLEVADTVAPFGAVAKAWRRRRSDCGHRANQDRVAPHRIHGALLFASDAHLFRIDSHRRLPSGRPACRMTPCGASERRLGSSAAYSMGATACAI